MSSLFLINFSFPCYKEKIIFSPYFIVNDVPLFWTKYSTGFWETARNANVNNGSLSIPEKDLR